MHGLIALLTALLLIPAALAGISSGLHQLLAAFDELPRHWGELVQAAQPLGPACQSLLCLLGGALVLGTAVGLLVHGLKSRT